MQNKPISQLFLTTIFLYPLLFNLFFTFYENFEISKTAFLTGASIILFLMIIATNFSLAVKALAEWGRNKITISWLTLMGLYVLFSFKSGLFHHTLFGSYTRSDGLIALAAITLLFFESYFVVNFNKLKVEIILKTLVYSGLVVAILGILQFSLALLEIISDEYLLDNRVTSTLGQPNVYGAFLVALIPLMVFLKIEKWVLYTILAAAILSFSKSALLILAIFFISKYISGMPSDKETRRKLTIRWSIAILLIIIFRWWIYWLVESFSFLYQFQRILFFLSENNWTDSLRLNLWDTAIRASSKAYFLGYGKGNIDLAYHLTANNIAEKYKILVDSSHNLFLDVLLEAGILGVVAISYFYFKFFTTKTDRPYLKYCQLAVGILLFRGLFDITPISLWALQIILIGISLPQRGNA